MSNIQPEYSNADHGNWNGYQLITPKRGNSSNSLDFKKVYFLYRFTEKVCYCKDTGRCFLRNSLFLMRSCGCAGEIYFPYPFV